MVACHLNFQFQVFTFLKRIKELGVVHFTMDTRSLSFCLGLWMLELHLVGLWGLIIVYMWALTFY
jgi:hypothetical protein